MRIIPFFSGLRKGNECSILDDPEEFTRALRSGNEALQNRAFHCLYKTVYGPVKKYILGHGGKESEAEDVFQDTLMTLISNITEKNLELTGDAAVQKYTMTTAKNIWNSYLRKWKNTSSAVEEPTEHFDLEELLQAKEDEKALSRAINALKTKDCKEVIHLFYFEEKSMQEIAEILDKTAGSIKSNKPRCIEELKKNFTEFALS